MAEETPAKSSDEAVDEKPLRTKRDDSSQGKKKTVLVLGGGAPNSTLMAGALYAFEEKKVKFDIIYTSGAGALMGLLYVAPNGKSPYDALRGTVDLMGVSDSIYRRFPVGYKTFFKPGPFTRPLHRWGEMFKLGQSPPRLWSGYLGRREDALKRWYNAWNDLWRRNFGDHGNAFQRLYNDLIDLWLVAMNPSDLNPFSKGMCASFPNLEEMVDFAKLELFPGEFYMNAFNITDQKMEIFNKREIVQNPEIFRAALAMPFIYPPVEVKGKLYIEGADHDPISFGNLRRRPDNDDIKTIVVFDILSTLDDYIVREPRNVWDAYQISIMAPIVSLAKKNIQAFKDWVQTEKKERKHKGKVDGYELDAYILNFEIPKRQQEYLLDWSYSNLLSNWNIGYRTGLEFIEQLGAELAPRSKTEEEVPLKPARRVFQKARGSDVVRRVQQRLQAEGIPNTPSHGMLDEKTKDAVRRFQEARGLRDPTGDLDTETLIKLGL